jgi:hypothetical protein
MSRRGSSKFIEELMNEISIKELLGPSQTVQTLQLFFTIFFVRLIDSCREKPFFRKWLFSTYNTIK